jgi:hypothetical protein
MKPQTTTSLRTECNEVKQSRKARHCRLDLQSLETMNAFNKGISAFVRMIALIFLDCFFAPLIAMTVQRCFVCYKYKSKLFYCTSSSWKYLSATFLFIFCITHNSIMANTTKKSFTFTQISEAEFKRALKNNYNAPVVTEITDTTKLEKAFDAIAKTYNEEEKELAEFELITPRELTSFEAYYLTFDLYLFYVHDYHYQKACFVFASTSEMASGSHRFRGSYGIMSKDGLWAGLERSDCDNYLQIEICESSKYGVWSLFVFDFAGIDIDEEKETIMFWADKNTIYLATREYDKDNKLLLQYYAIRFEY